MMRRLGSVMVLASAATLVAPSALAQAVYKWTDERGVVNYTTEAPKNRPSKEVDVETGRLTVVPGLPTPPVREDPNLRRRVDELERERDSARSAARADADSAAAQIAAWRERCRNERWADCDDDRALLARYAGGYGGYPAYGYGYAVPPRVVRPLPTPRPLTQPVQPPVPQQRDQRNALSPESYPRPYKR
jgi:hypothetical protein